MLSITQGIGEIVIFMLGTIVATIALAVFLVWGVKEIVVHKPTILKWILIILFVCMVLTFMPQLS